jgi:hypothetical protein
MVAFWFRRIKANALFYGSVISEVFIILIYKADVISFLWLNVIGAILVILIGYLLQGLIGNSFLKIKHKENKIGTDHPETYRL